MERRQFLEVSGKGALGVAVLTATAGGATFLLSGCNVFTDIENWVPVGEAALNSILSVLTANGVLIAAPVQAIVSLIEAGFAALTAAIKEYQSTTPAPIGALAKIETAFKDIADNFTTFLQSLGVSGGLLGIIVGLGQIIFSTIAGFMNQLPASSSLHRTVTIGSTMRVGSTTAPVTPKARTRRVFKKDMNSVLDGGKAIGVVIPPSAYLKVSFWEHL